MISEDGKNKIGKIYNKIVFVLEFFLSLGLSIALINLFYKNDYFGVMDSKYIVLTALFGIPVIAIILFNIKSYKDKIEKIFLTIAIPIGMMYTIFLLPTYVPDENAHVFRAFEVSQGIFINNVNTNKDGNSYSRVPMSILENTMENLSDYSMLMDKINLPSDYSNVKAIFNPAQSYFPLLYIFSCIPFFIGRMLSLNIIVVMYAAKLFNFIAFLAFGYFIIKKIPFGKLLMLGYLMLPMSLHQGTSISADSLTNSISLMFIAYVLKLIFDKDKITTIQKVLLGILTILLALAKSVYIPLLLLAWLIIPDKKYPKKEKIIFLAIITIIGIFVGGAWYLVQTQYVDIREYVTINNINGSEQLKFIMQNPLHYIKIMWNTIYNNGEDYIYTLVGSTLGWLDIEIPNLTVIGLIITILAAPFLEDHKVSFNKWQKVWVILIFIAITVLIITGLYMGWSSVGSDEAAGIQGRYFIPCAILPLLCLCSKGKYIKYKYTNVIYPIILIYLNWFALDSIIKFLM